MKINNTHHDFTFPVLMTRTVLLINEKVKFQLNAVCTFKIHKLAICLLISPRFIDIMNWFKFKLITWLGPSLLPNQVIILLALFFLFIRFFINIEFNTILIIQIGQEINCNNHRQIKHECWQDGCKFRQFIKKGCSIGHPFLLALEINLCVNIESLLVWQDQ